LITWTTGCSGRCPDSGRGASDLSITWPSETRRSRLGERPPPTLGSVLAQLWLAIRGAGMLKHAATTRGT
jgi:hypothetical protein